jgi:hypothetical protein
MSCQGASKLQSCKILGAVAKLPFRNHLNNMLLHFIEQLKKRYGNSGGTKLNGQQG